LVNVIWDRLVQAVGNVVQAKHFLWTLHFLKSLDPNHSQVALHLKTTYRTLKFHVNRVLPLLLIALPDLDFAQRFRNWRYLSPSCLVDTTFVHITQPYLSPWEYYSQNKKDFGLDYQVVCSLGKPFCLLSFEGPFKGSAADVSIFRDTLKPLLREGERVMCDRGYYQDERCWCPPLGDIDQLTIAEKIRRRAVTSIRHLVERIIGRLKFWGCMKKRWQYGFQFHSLCAQVAAKLTQLEVHAYPLT